MALNVEQKRAVRSLITALNKAHDAGLMGGVYDSSFCVWPIGTVDLDAPPINFFHQIEEHGRSLSCDEVRMRLDGGAGT